MSKRYYEIKDGNAVYKADFDSEKQAQRECDRLRATNWNTFRTAKVYSKKSGVGYIVIILLPFIVVLLALQCF